MYDYTRKLRLAAGDVFRRSVLKTVAGLIIAVGAGFLIAALWSWLAIGLGWGATYASLTIGGGLFVIGGIVLLIAAKPRHHFPDSDELKREVEEQINHAANLASDRARYETERIVGMAEDKVFGLFGGAGGQVRRSIKDADRIRQKVADASDSNTGNIMKLLGAFTIGVALASKLNSKNRDEER